MSPTPDRTLLPTALTLRFTNGRAVALRLPADWGSWQDDAGAALPPDATLSFGPTGATPRLLLNILFGEPGSPDLTTEAQQQFTRASIDAFEGEVVTTAVDVNSLQAMAGSGFWYVLTDIHPVPDGFRYQTQGSFISGPSMLRFTLLTDEGEEATWNAGLSVATTASLLDASQDELSDDLAQPSPDAATPTIAAFLRIAHADEACLFVQDHPELLDGHFVGMLLVPWGGLEKAPACVQVACLCLQRVVATSAAVAIGPAAFDAVGSLLLQVVGLLVSASAPEHLALRLQALERLDATAVAPGTADAELRLRDWLRLDLADELLQPDFSGAPPARQQAYRLLTRSVGAMGRPHDRFLQAHVHALLSHLAPIVFCDHRAERLEAAIGIGQRALAAFEFSGLRFDWATLQLRVGMKFSERVAGDPERNIEEAVARFKLALAASEPDSPNARAAHTNIGLACLQSEHRRDPATIAFAIEHLEAALLASSHPGAALARAQLNLGKAKLVKGHGDVDALEEAIDLFKAAEAVFTRSADPVNWAGIQHNLGAAHAMREIGDENANRAEAALRFERALEIRTLAALPAEHLATNAAMAGVEMAGAAFEPALGHLQSALAADALLARDLLLRTEVRDRYARSERLYTECAFCLLKLGRFAQALETLEAGRARELQRILASADDAREPAARVDPALVLRDAVLGEDTPLVTDTPQQRALRQAAAQQRAALFEHVAALAADAQPAESAFRPASADDLLAGVVDADIVVMSLLSQVGAATFILRAGSRALSAGDVVWHADFSLVHAERLLIGSKRIGLERGWLPAYFDNRKNAAAWQQTIRDTGRLLWNGLVGEIRAALGAGEIAPSTRIVLVAPPELALLPWHASWRTVDGARRYLGDDVTLSHAPSLAVLAALRKAQSRRPPPDSAVRSSLVVADTESNLPFAAIEGQLVARLAATAADDLLIGAASSFVAVSKAAPRQDLLHFACHGTFQLRDPMWSWLSLGRSGVDAPGTTGRLRLRELVTTWRGLAASLVVLSACETGIPEVMDLPGESLSLATGFLGAGALAVISSFWIVDDFCTLMIMSRFYAEYLGAGGSSGSVAGDAAASLGQAQSWIRSASTRELAAAVATLEALPGLPASDGDRLRARRLQFEALPEPSRPYAEPYWWAGFGISGVQASRSPGMVLAAPQTP